MAVTAGYAEPMPPMVSVFTLGWGLVPIESVSSSVPASATWEAAGVVVYCPVIVPSVCILRRVWWVNGATTSGAATVEAGIYRDEGAFQPVNKLISGSATQGTALQVQFVDVTDTTLTPGLWWLALMCSSATNTTIFRASINASSAGDALYRFEQGSANPLPATATPVESTNVALYLFGFSTTTIT